MATERSRQHRWILRFRNVVVRLLEIAAAVVIVRVGWHLIVRDDARALIDGHTEAELVARRDYLGAHIDDMTHSLAPKDTQFAGEWSVVTLSMTAIAAANIGFEHSSTVPSDLELVTRCAELARKKEQRKFDADRWGDDPIDAISGPNAHIGYLGHLGMILEAYRLLGGRDAELLALETKLVAALGDKLSHANHGLLPTYDGPNETYVADNAVVLAVLALSDLGRAARTHRALLAGAIATWRAELVDTATGVLVFREAHSAPRASGAAFAAMMLAYVDEAFSKEQAIALAAHFGGRVFGVFGAMCEHPSCAGSGDVDSGPLVRGASPSASGFAIALAKRAGDEAELSSLLATAEWAGVTFSWSGRRRYLLAPLVGDAIVLAGKSARAWDARYL